MAHTVKLTVKPMGKIESKVEGIKGPSCGEKTRWLDSLGRIVVHEDTDEYHEHCETETETETVAAGWGDSSDW
jgi:hypothetical protein